MASQFARAVKVWLRDTAPLSFTHRALLRLVTQCSHWKTDRRGAVHLGCFFILLLFGSIEDRGGGGGGLHFENSPSLTVGRTSSTATNCSSKVWKIRHAVPDLHNEATEPFLHTSCTFPKAVGYIF